MPNKTFLCLGMIAAFTLYAMTFPHQDFNLTHITDLHYLIHNRILSKEYLSII